MNILNRSRILPSNDNYFFYSFDYFLKSQKELGFTRFELYASPPHVFVTDYALEEKDELLNKISEYDMRVEAVRTDYKMNRYLLNCKDKERFIRSMDYYKRCLDLCAELNCKALSISVAGSFLDEAVLTVKNRAFSRLLELLELANRMGICIYIDVPNGKDDFLSTLPQLTEMLDEIKYENIRINLDINQLEFTRENIMVWINSLINNLGFIRMGELKTNAEGDSLSYAEIIKMLELHGFNGFYSFEIKDEEHLQNPLNTEENNLRYLIDNDIINSSKGDYNETYN